MMKRLHGILIVLRKGVTTKCLQAGQTNLASQSRPRLSSTLVNHSNQFFRSDDLLLRTAANAKFWDGGRRQVQTKGDKELTEFLEEEIKAEMKNRKAPSPPKVDGFEITTDGSDVTLTKKFNDETIKVLLNVNHSVDAEEVQEPNPNQEKEPEMGEMKSKPNFSVEIIKGGKTMALECTFSTDMGSEDQTDESYNDVFQISELSIYEGEIKDSTYSVAGDIMDGYLYDLLMNMLEERGISNEFADKLVNYSTAYEHNLYINLLDQLKGFVSK